MKVVLATKTTLLADSLSAKVPAGDLSIIGTKGELARSLVDKEFKLVILTDDFDKSIEPEKLLQSYANISNYIVYVTADDNFDFISPFVRVYNKALVAADLDEIIDGATIQMERIIQNAPPQINEIKVISVWGVGSRSLKTTTAMNLGHIIAKNNPEEKIVVVGLNIENPTMPHLLRTEANAFDLLIPTVGGEFADFTLLDGAAYKYPETENLHIIGGLDDITLFHRLDSNFVDRLLSLLKEKYRYVILDLGSSLITVPTIVGLQNSDLVINIVDRDIGTFIYGWRNAKKMLRSLGVRLNNMVMVTNHFFPNAEYSDEKIQQHVGLYNIGVIPNLGEEVQTCALKKKLLLDAGEGSKPLQEYRKLLENIYSYVTKEKPKEQRGWLMSFLGRFIEL